jgi:hypothetical protein
MSVDASKNLKRLVFISTIASLCVMLSNCASEHHVDINDFSESRQLSFSTSENRTVYGIVLHIKSDIEGKLRVVTPPCGDIILFGKQDTTIRCDWFAPKIDITVLPIEDSKGHLSLSMKFIESF